MHPIFNTFRPDGFGTVNAYIFASNPEALIKFYKDAFYAEELDRTMNAQTGDIANCILRIGTNCVMVSQARGQFVGMRSAFYLYVDDVDQVHKNALDHGGKLVFNPSDMEYYDRQSGITDPAGNYWWISMRLHEANYWEQ